MDEKPQDADFYPPAEDYGITTPGKNSRESAAWYFTREGNRQGPVPYSQLRETARQGILNPRHDMVWTKGMADWQVAGEVEGLFERVITAPPVEEQAAVEEDPFIPPEMQETTHRQQEWPGYNRKVYLFILIVFPVLCHIGLTLATPFLSKQLPPGQLIHLPIVGVVLPAIIAFFVSLGRLANLGMSRWWILGNLVPLLNLWLGFRSFACPAGYAQDKKLDAAGIFLAIIYWLLITAIIAAIAFFIMVVTGPPGNPESLQKLQEIMKLSRSFSKP